MFYLNFLFSCEAGHLKCKKLSGSLDTLPSQQCILSEFLKVHRSVFFFFYMVVVLEERHKMNGQFILIEPQVVNKIILYFKKILLFKRSCTKLQDVEFAIRFPGWKHVKKKKWKRLHRKSKLRKKRVTCYDI